MSNARKLVLLAVAVLLVGGLVYFLSGRGNETGTAPAEQTSPGIGVADHLDVPGSGNNRRHRGSGYGGG